MLTGSDGVLRGAPGGHPDTDPDAPIARIADYAITGDVNEVIPKMIKYYKQNSK